MPKSTRARAAKVSPLLAKPSGFVPHTVVSVSDFDDADWKSVAERRDAGKRIGRAFTEVRIAKDFKKRFGV